MDLKFLAALWCCVFITVFMYDLVDGTESNIYKIARPKKVLSTLDSDVEFFGEEWRSRHPRTTVFSKNNPEYDWKKYLRKEEVKKKTYDLDFMTEKLNRTGNSIQWLDDLYNPLKWTKVPGEVSQSCEKDLETFLQALRDGMLWAAKLADASGRYSSQFHFGNGFWMGSKTLCRELNMTVGISGNGIPIDVQPYSVSFHVARMYLIFPNDLSFGQERLVFIGLCLPVTCDHESITSILRASADRVETEGNSTHQSTGPKVQIVEVKPVPSSDYSPFADGRFYTLIVICIIVGLLMMCAAIVDERARPSHDLDLVSCNSSNNNGTGGKLVEKSFDSRKTTTTLDKEFIEKNIRGVGSEDIPHRQVRKNIVERYLSAFNPFTNGAKILSTRPASRDSFTCLHGLRVLSLGWVVLVHTYLQVFSIAENKILRMVTERNFMFQTISNATFSVDTFFFISGLLVTFLFYRSTAGTEDSKGNFIWSSASKFGIMLFYRFIRLTPAYLFVLGVNQIAVRYAMSTTVFSPQVIDHVTCEKYWWRNALYINSLFPRTEMCMLWSWYMANDTQFYVLGIFLLLISVKYFRTVVITSILLVCSSWATTFTIAFSNDYVARIQEPFALFDELYDKPWLRAGPYFIGCSTGYILYKTNSKIRTPLIFRATGWIVASVIMASVVFGLYADNLSVMVSSIYASLAHTAWAIAVSFVVIQCCTGSAPMINRLLSLKLMYPLSKLTYCAYLVHPVIMMVTVMYMDGPLHLHNGIVLIVYFGNLVAAYLVSFFISVAFEAPIVNILKIAFSQKSTSR